MNNMVGSEAATRYWCAELRPTRVDVETTVFADSGKSDIRSPAGPAEFRASWGNTVVGFALGAIDGRAVFAASVVFRPESKRKATATKRERPTRRFATRAICGPLGKPNAR